MKRPARDEARHQRNREIVLAYQQEQCPIRKSRLLEVVIEENMGLVDRVVSKWPTPISVGHEDLRQVGVIGGLVMAADRWHEGKAAFSTYATYWIRQAVSRAWGYHENSVKIPEHHRRKLEAQARARQEVEDEAAASEERNPEQQDSWISQIKVARSSSITDEMSSMVADTEATDPVRAVERSSMEADVARAIRMLDERNRKIVAMHMDGKLDREIAKTLGVSRARIQELREKAFVQLAAVLSSYDPRI